MLFNELYFEPEVGNVSLRLLFSRACREVTSGREGIYVSFLDSKQHGADHVGPSVFMYLASDCFSPA